MRIFLMALAASSLLAATACGGKDPNRDVSQVGFTPDTSAVMSPMEMGRDTQPAAALVAANAAPVPAHTSTRSAVHHSTTRHHYYSSASAPAPAPTRTIKHTKRDAAIGVAAGAAVGGLTSHSVKGAVIGGVVGGVLGGVIGNNVDVKHKR